MFLDIQIGLVLNSTLASRIGNYGYSNLEISDTALKAGESRKVLIIDEMPSEIISKILGYMNEVEVNIEYCSIYKKCWQNEGNKIIELD